MVQWTKEQWDAITIDDKNMIVSAAAGSGKTAVLVERIKRLVIEKNVGIDRFLIVTFTKAAASEMKEKLIKAINAEIKASSENSAFLKKQLDLMVTANISTFHAFAMAVIRRYFYLTDLEPNFKIGDEGAVEILKREVLDQIFEDYFESDSPEFLEFLRCYGSDRHEKALKENVLKIYDTIQSIPHPMEWLSMRIQQMGESAEDFFKSKIGESLKKTILKDVEDAVYWFYEAAESAKSGGDARAYTKLTNYRIDFLELLNYIREDNFDRAVELVKDYDFGRLTLIKMEDDTKKEIFRARDTAKGLIIGLRDSFLSKPMNELLEDIQYIKPHAVFLEQLLQKFHLQFRKAKKKKNIIDFNDIEHYALEILENEEAAAEYREKFRYIFVDEYQDSNVMQDTLINLIKRENNLFLVGDIKQSIYKFRLAEPEIFQERYKNYADPLDEHSIKIDLNKNFRSKGEVIKSVNFVFRSIMKDYDSAASLKQGDSYIGELDFPTEMYMIDTVVTEDMDLSIDLEEMKNTELEAYCAAENIRNLIGTTIFDSKKQCEREVTYKDIVILMRSTRSAAEIFQKVFQQQNIPVYVDDSAGYFDTIEIQVFLNLLTIIDNKQQDIPLLSVLHSVMFDFSVEELIQIRLFHPKGSYYEALEAFANQESDGTVIEKCRLFFEKNEVYRNMALSLPLEELVWNLMWETGYYTYCGALPAGMQRQANLKALADKARSFTESGYGGIYGFLTYIRAMEKREIKTGQVKLINENDDLVRIMTIHKSKGLEFPVVILAGLGKQLRRAGGSYKILAHKDFGIGMARVDYKQHWSRKTLIQMVIEKKMQQEELEESIRILYVALTRAKDRLILIGSKKDLDKEPKKKNSFLDYLMPIGEKYSFYCYRLDRNDMDDVIFEHREDRNKLRELIDSCSNAEETEQYRSMDERFEFRYANEAALTKKSKYFVTEYSKVGTPYETYVEELKVPAFMQTDSEISSARKGTIMHKVMEVIDFKEAYRALAEGTGTEYVKEQLQYMKDKELLLEEEVQYVEPDKIKRFFQSEVGERAAKAEVLEKEAEFNYLKEVDGVEVMVQGIIDCYFEEGEELVLVDYKNSYMNPEKREKELNRLKKNYARQVELYKEALELIKGKKVKDSYLYVFSEGEFIKMI